MATIVCGAAFVFGVPPIVKQITGIPSDAKVRVRFRRGCAAKVFVRIGGQTSVHEIAVREFETGVPMRSGVWCLGPALGLNQKS